MVLVDVVLCQWKLVNVVGSYWKMLWYKRRKETRWKEKEKG